MLRRPFAQQQRRLQDKVLVLGSQIEEVLRDSVEVLKQGDPDRAISLLTRGCRLIKNCVGIENDTLALLATQQPIAGDLRFLTATFQISLELGRATNICEWVLYAVTGKLIETNVEVYERTH